MWAGHRQIDKMFTDTGKEEIRLFADRITPANWIFPKTVGEDQRVMKDISEGAKCVVGNLYLNLFFFDEQYEEDSRAGQVTDPMKYWNGAAYGNLAVFYHTEEMVNDGFSWKGTIIHELAHNAADRYLLWKTTRSQFGMAWRPTGFDMHGPEFQRALLVVLRRAIKNDTELTDEVIDEIDSELTEYASFYDDGL